MKHSLTLSEAVETALKENAVLKIGRTRVLENDERIASARSQYFPQLTNNTKYVHLSEQQKVSIPAGSLGQIAGSDFPNRNINIRQSDSTVLYNETTLAQPTMQLFKIHEANQIARADRGIAKAELTKSENETVLAVHQLYYELLVAYKAKVAAEASLTAAQENLREAEDAVKAGNLLEVSVITARANLLQRRQELLSADNHIADVTSELNDLLGFPSEDLLEVTEAGFPELPETPRDESYQEARARNGNLLAARETLEKSRHAVKAAQYEYIPDVTLFYRHGYQDGVAFLKDNVDMVGVEVSWNVFDWGKRRGEIGQRAAQQSQAEQNLARLDKRVGIEIDKVYRKLERAKKAVDAAREALAMSQEDARLNENRLKAGTVTAAIHAEAVASLRKAEMEELQAVLGYRLTRAELDRIRGVLASSR